MGWWVENSKFPLHEDMSRANFAKMEKDAVQTRQNPTWGEVVDSISTLPKGENSYLLYNIIHTIYINYIWVLSLYI